MFHQHQDREGEEGAREAARDDPDRNQWGRNRRGDGEGEEVLPAADVRGQSRLFTLIMRRRTKCYLTLTTIRRCTASVLSF